MPVNPVTIRQQVSDLIKNTQTLEPAAAEEAFATGLTNIITQAILSATVTVTVPPATFSVGASPAVLPSPVPVPLTGILT
jgi:hypothetical protein